MRLLKSSTLLGLYNSYVVDSPQPANLSYMWNFGSLLAVCLGTQIVTGVLLAMHYTPNIDLAFVSVEHIMRDVNYGWLLRYIHANVASFFFIFVYGHIARNLYYGSYKSPRVLPWSIGVIMLVLMMGIAFLGYVLPYGQMSLWGATVITNMLSAVPWIGGDFVQFPYLSLSLLPLGTIRYSAMRGRKPLTSAQLATFLLVPKSLVAFLAGLVDGDGYIACLSTTKGFISIQLVIKLTIADAPMLYQLQAALGLGRVVTYPKHGTATLIFSRVELQEVLFPLLMYHGIVFLTDTRRAQYDMAVFIMLSGLTRYNDLPSQAPVVSALPSTAEGYLAFPWFSDWVVGFTTAEGSFFVKDDGEVGFSLTQRPHAVLFEALKLLFKTNRTVGITDGSMKLSVGSVVDVQTVVSFFSFSGHHPLMGLKAASYRQWLDYLRVTPRFKSVKLP